MSENRARYPIAVMCRILGVSPSGYYAWVKRPASARALMDAALTAEIRAAHAASKGTYGAPRLQIDLAEAGIRVSRKRVARLMLNAGLVGVSRRKSAVTTVRDGARQAPDLVDRNFTADQPNRLWVADIPYIPTWGGFLYLAVVLDAFSRRIVGWSMATTLHMQVVLDALNMALWQRRPSGVIHLRIMARSIPRSSSANDVERQAFAPRWGRSETPTTTRWRSVSSPRSNVSCSIGVASRRRPKRAWPSSNSSRASTIRAGGTHRIWCRLGPISASVPNRSGPAAGADDGLVFLAACSSVGSPIASAACMHIFARRSRKPRWGFLVYANQ